MAVGLSKGKRLLDVETTEQYLRLGDEMKVSGNGAFSTSNFEMALTRWATISCVA